MTSRITKNAGGLCAALAIALLGASAAQARDRQPPPPTAAPPTLGTEILTSGDDPAAGQIDGTCNPLAPSTFQFHVTGTATGAFAGKFVESGSFTISSGRLTAFHSRFVISAPAGFVFGERVVTPDQLGHASAYCGELAWGFHNGVYLQVAAGYSASIISGFRVTTDTGTSLLTYGDVGSRAVPQGMAAFQFVAVPS